MKNKPIIIVAGDPNSIFFEIFFKSLKILKLKSPIILITSLSLFRSQMKKFGFKKNIKILNSKNLGEIKIDKKIINIINVHLDFSKSHIYIKKSFDIAFKLLNLKITDKFINGPINKTIFLNKKFPGITEYISKKFNVNKSAMLIYNEEISVSPLTTHLPIKLIPKKINKKSIEEKIILINDFFVKKIGFKPMIAVTGLNPHCETILKYNEDDKIIAPTIKSLKKRGFKVYGPYPADTIFLKQNRKKFNVILGMYHDQVLAPIKTLKEYDAFNITLGLPFYRISPDHGPNRKMKNKNSSTPVSLIKSIKFLDKR